MKWKMANRKNISSVRFKKRLLEDYASKCYLSSLAILFSMKEENGMWRGTNEAQIHVARPKSKFSPRC